MIRFLSQNLNLNTIQQNAEPNAAFPVGTSIGDIVSKIIPWIFTFAGMALLVYLILGGFQLMTSRGEPKAMAAARQHITNALIGFAIIFFAYWAVQLIGLILNLPGIKSVFGT